MASACTERSAGEKSLVVEQDAGWQEVARQVHLKGLSRHVSWAEIVSEVEALKCESWERFRQRHGDWGRDAALYLGRRHGRLTPAQLGELPGGLDYAAVGQAVSRFGRRLEHGPALRGEPAKLGSQLSNVES